MKLDNIFLEAVRAPIVTVWGTIGYDIIECCESMGEGCDNEQAIESCIDANYLTMYTSKEADVLVSEMCKEHGYDKVLKFLAKNIRLN